MKPLQIVPRRTVLERLSDATSTAPTSPVNPVMPVADPFQGKSFRLDMVNAAEDIPRVIRTYVKLKGMECALVLRPHDGQGVMVHAEGGQAWKWTGLESDVPQRPNEAVALSATVPVLKGAQQSLPPQGPVTLRGQWSGKLSCDNGNPRISLERRVASYGTLHVWSDAVKKVWHWQVERVEKWFSRSGKQDGTATTLVQAIRDGLANAMGLLGEACSVRDSRRRAALDSTYAETHPNKPAREGKDPTEKFNPKEPKQAKAPATRAPKTAPATASPAQSTTAPVTAKAARRRGPAPANSAMPVPAPGSTPDAGDIDPAKDKLLLDAFGDAISKALAQIG